MGLPVYEPTKNRIGAAAVYRSLPDLGGGVRGGVNSVP